MLKQGGGKSIFGRKSWNERYFVLRGGQLAYYRDRAAFLGGAHPLKGTVFDVANCTVSLTSRDGERRLTVKPDHFAAGPHELSLLPTKPDSLGSFDGWVDVLNPINPESPRVTFAR